jgi:hypothetical protein
VLHMMRIIVQYEEHHKVHGSQIDHYETAKQKLRQERDEEVRLEQL